jgi:hypothetical protein
LRFAIQLLGKERQLKESNEAEIAMRKVLDDYTRKYGELTRSLDSSNVSFDKVKDQMSKMNGNLIKVQADSKKWKEKAEEANKFVHITLSKFCGLKSLQSRGRIEPGKSGNPKVVGPQRPSTFTNAGTLSPTAKGSTTAARISPSSFVFMLY